MVLLILTAFPRSGPCAQEQSDDSDHAPPKAARYSQPVRKALSQYAAARASAKRRAAAIKDLTEIGDEGIAAAKELCDKELKRLEPQLGTAPGTAAFDAKIAELRKILVQLRKDPNLSHEQLESIGLPALEQLTLVYSQRLRKLAPHKERAAKALGQLRQFADLLRTLKDDWKQSPPLPVDDYLAKAEKILAAATTPEEETARKVAEENATLTPRLDRDLVVGMQAVNNIRMTCGLRPLAYDLKLCQAAAGHSSDMQAAGFFAHESPLPGKRTPWDRAKLAGTTASGENIYMGSAVSADAIKAWFLSPGHHKNMFAEDSRRQGLGRCGKFWTQEFGN
jgi:uncharacterized protein YkwD